MIETDEIPVDIWRHILLFVPPSNIHHCCLVNKLLNDLCFEPKLFSNLVIRIKCFSTIPFKIDDITSTISISIYDEHNSYFRHYKEIEHKTNDKSSQIYKGFKIWLKRLSKCKYLDMGSFPLDEEYLTNKPLKDTIENIISDDNFQALHFDGFYSDEVKIWFLSHIIPKLSSEIRHISLRWDQWKICNLQIIDKIFDHFWVSIDGRSHSYQFPIHYEILLTDNNRIKFERLEILSIYRLYFPDNTLQSLLFASINLKILYMFASSWRYDKHSEFENFIILPKGLRSISILLCDGVVLLDKCYNDLRHIMLDSPTNQIAKSILQQLINGIKCINLQKLSVCFWSGITDKSQDTDTEKEIELIVNLICKIHQHGKTKKFNTLSVNFYDEIIEKNLKQKLNDELSILYQEKFDFFVEKVENMAKNCQFILDDKSDQRFIKDIYQRKFGLLRNT